MVKVMLVEDDKSLREIYGVRLLAEGYDIVSAGDGEEALAMAIKERPQLIISDVMMPKVSGYDMLDILRSTTETRGIKVIMMTALSSDEQRTRAESLGADRYLVKSQVGIEDVVRVVHEVLKDGPQGAAAPASPTVPMATPPAPTANPTPAQPAPLPSPTPVVPATPAPINPQPVAPAAVSPQPQQPFTPAPTPSPEPTTPPVTRPIMDIPKPASLKTRVIQPLSDPNVSPININDLLDKELAKEAGLAGSDVVEAIPTTAEEKALVAQQLESWHAPEPTPVEELSSGPSTVPVNPGNPLMPTPSVSMPPSTSIPVTDTPVEPTQPAQPPTPPVAQ